MEDWAAIRSAAPPKYKRAARGSFVDAAEPDIRRLLRAHPRMPASVIAERIRGRDLPAAERSSAPWTWRRP